jgi:hypothetical protein
MFPGLSRRSDFLSAGYLRRIDAGIGRAGKRLFRRIAADATNGEARTHRLYERAA